MIILTLLSFKLVCCSAQLRDLWLKEDICEGNLHFLLGRWILILAGIWLWWCYGFLPLSFIINRLWERTYAVMLTSVHSTNDNGVTKCGKMDQGRNGLVSFLFFFSCFLFFFYLLKRFNWLTVEYFRNLMNIIYEGSTFVLIVKNVVGVFFFPFQLVVSKVIILHGLY